MLARDLAFADARTVDGPRDAGSWRDTLRLALIIAVALLVVGFLLWSGLTGLAADPMAGT